MLRQMGRLTWRCAVSTCTDQLGTLAGAFRASEPSQVRLSTRIGWHPCRSDTARPSRAGSLAVSTEPEAVSAPVPILGTGVGIASRVCKELKQRGAAMHAHHQPNESGRCGRGMEEGNMGAAGRWWWWRRRCWRGTDASPPPPPPSPTSLMLYIPDVHTNAISVLALTTVPPALTLLWLADRGSGFGNGTTGALPEA